MSQNEMDSWDLPNEEEAKSNAAVSAPLRDGTYAIRLTKITFEKAPSWNAALQKYDHSKLNPAFKIVALPFNDLLEGEIKDVNGREVKPLTTWIFREINPFSLGFQQGSTEPAFMRALLAYVSGQDVKGNIKPPAIIILDKNDNIASEADAAKYKEQFMQLKKNEIQPEQFTMRNAEGFKHIPDIRGWEGKYVGARIAVKGDSNKITAFTKLPSNFVAPDESAIQEQLNKFNEGYAKYLAKKGATNSTPATASNSVSTDDVATDIQF